MLRTYQEIADFRNNCVNHNLINFYDAYEELSLDKSDGDWDEELYEQIEQALLDWIRTNVKHDVYYIGDLRFEFENKEERDQFDKENGDPIAFKLTFL